MALATETPPAAPGDPHAGHAHGQPVYPGQPAAYQQDRVSRFGGFLERLWMRPAWVAPLAVLACVAGTAGLFMATDPTDGRPDAFSGCAVKALTGFDCPGCGGTRALWYLAHGNLPEAARHHLIAVFAAPFIIYLYLAWAGQRMFRWTLPQLRISPRMVGYFLGAWGVFMVLRNLPWEPFTYFYV